MRVVVGNGTARFFMAAIRVVTVFAESPLIRLTRLTGTLT